MWVGLVLLSLWFISNHPSETLIHWSRSRRRLRDGLSGLPAAFIYPTGSSPPPALALICPCSASAPPSRPLFPEGKDEVSSSSAAHNALLRTALFGPDTPKRREEPLSPSRAIFWQKTETKRPLHSITPLGFEEDEAATAATRGPVKAPRKAPRSPYEVKFGSPYTRRIWGLLIFGWIFFNQ